MIYFNQILNFTISLCFWFLIYGILDIFEISIFQYSVNIFIIISLCRTLLIFVLLEISFGLFFFDFSRNYFIFYFGYIYFFFIIFFNILCDKSPFDFIESESELIDGITLDTNGIIFSLLFSSETFIWLTFNIVFIIVFNNLFFILFYFQIIAISFVGRIFLSRVSFIFFMDFIFNIGIPIVLLFDYIFIIVSQYGTNIYFFL